MPSSTLPTPDPAFVAALVYYADLKGSAGAQEISDEFNALFAAVKSAGKDGKEVINSSVNGRNFGYELTMSAEQRLASYGAALREINGDKIVCTVPDFRFLQR